AVLDLRVEGLLVVRDRRREVTNGDRDVVDLGEHSEPSLSCPWPVRTLPAGRDPGGYGARLARVSGVELAGALEGTAEGDLVCILEVAADGQPAREPSHLHAERAEQADEIHRGRFSLDVRVRREDDLLHAFPVDAHEQLAHAELLGTDALDRR